METAKSIRVIMPGKGELSLLPQDHLATGGEGAVYLKNGLAFKLYLDPQKARSHGMEAKIRLLAGIRHPYILAPLDILCNPRQEMIGYYMPMASGVPLMRVFTSTWRDQNNFTDREAIKLVENMRMAVQAAHGLAALIVDGNETNWLADGISPHIIDVDSWQIGPFPATAVMASIHDFHAAAPCQGSDWFAWGIVTFQVFTGIHPYKGVHPDFKKGDLEARMRANVSIFDPRTKRNSAVRSFSVIPPNLASWYEGMFQQGDRSAPPPVQPWTPTVTAPTILHLHTAGPGLLKHECFMNLPGLIKKITDNGIAFFEKDGLLWAHDLEQRRPLPDLGDETIQAILQQQACLVRKGPDLMLVNVDGPSLRASILSSSAVGAVHMPQPMGLPFQAAKLVTWGDRAFALNFRSENGMTEINLEVLQGRPVLSLGASWPVHPLSTRFFDGFGVMDCLGQPFVVQPEGPSAVLIHRAPALGEYRLVNGQAANRHHLMLHAIRKADGRLYRLRLDLMSGLYNLISAVPVDVADLNVAVNAKGIAVAIFEDEEVTVWNTLGQGEKTIADPAIVQNMRLFALNDAIYYHTGGKIFRLSLN